MKDGGSIIKQMEEVESFMLMDMSIKEISKITYHMGKVNSDGQMVNDIKVKLLMVEEKDMEHSGFQMEISTKVLGRMI